MKHVLYLLICLSVTSIAAADSYSGSMRATALPSILDYNGDGISGRDFRLPTLNDGHWDAVEGSVDTGLIAPPREFDLGIPNACQLDSDYELTIQGDVVFLGKKTKKAVILEPDSSIHVCFTPGNTEVVELFVTRAVDDNGHEVPAYGTAQIRLLDVIIRANPVTGFPEIVVTTGDYDLNVFYN